jgi:hypothetical protein
MANTKKTAGTKTVTGTLELNKLFDAWAKRLKTPLTVQKALEKCADLWAGSGSGLSKWQADTLERYGLDSFGGAFVERARISKAVYEFFENVPADTVLGMYGAKLAQVIDPDSDILGEYYSAHFEYGSDKAIIVRNGPEWEVGLRVE